MPMAAEVSDGGLTVLRARRIEAQPDRLLVLQVQHHGLLDRLNLIA